MDDSTVVVRVPVLVKNFAFSITSKPALGRTGLFHKVAHFVSHLLHEAPSAVNSVDTCEADSLNWLFVAFGSL
jgi:hypothetical protein